MPGLVAGGPVVLAMVGLVWGLVMTIEELRETFTDKELAAMWCQLNRFEWPEALRADENSSRNNPYPMMVLIERAIGGRLCLAEWNRERL